MSAQHGAGGFMFAALGGTGAHVAVPHIRLEAAGAPPLPAAADADLPPPSAPNGFAPAGGVAAVPPLVVTGPVLVPEPVGGGVGIMPMGDSLSQAALKQSARANQDTFFIDSTLD
jgi:hypothetical protein